MPEVIHQVFSYSDNVSNSVYTQVCKQWSEIALDVLWKDVTDIRHLLARLAPLKTARNGLDRLVESLNYSHETPLNSEPL